MLVSFLVPAFGVSAGNSAQNQIVTANFTMMGTFVQIKVLASKSQIQSAHNAVQRAKDQMQTLVNLVSSWDPDSGTSRINENAGVKPVKIDSQLMNILVFAKDVSKISKGAFDLTYYPVAKLWDLGAKTPVIPNDLSIKQKLGLVDYRKLQLNPDTGEAFLENPSMFINLGGIAKGAVIDKGAESLKSDGFKNFLINAGGDLRVMGSKPSGPWSIGVTDPRNSHGPVIRKVPLQNGAVTTSGDYEKMIMINGKRYHHIIDPLTGWPADQCISVTVIAPDAITADAFSTAFFVLGSQPAIKLCEQLDNIEAFFVLPDLTTSCSSGFPK